MSGDVVVWQDWFSRVLISGLATSIGQRTFTAAGGLIVDDEVRVWSDAVSVGCLALCVGDIADAATTVKSIVDGRVEFVDGRAVGVLYSANTVAVGKCCVGIDK